MQLYPRAVPTSHVIQKYSVKGLFTTEARRSASITGLFKSRIVMSPNRIKKAAKASTRSQQSPPRWLALVPKDDPSTVPQKPVPMTLSPAEDMYARAALACYTKALTAQDPDMVVNLLEAGAWFARLGGQAEGPERG
jgi:hypothetical protein